jgi:hypothetical protein
MGVIYEAEDLGRGAHVALETLAGSTPNRMLEVVAPGLPG